TPAPGGLWGSEAVPSSPRTRSPTDPSGRGLLRRGTVPGVPSRVRRTRRPRRFDGEFPCRRASFLLHSRFHQGPVPPPMGSQPPTRSYRTRARLRARKMAGIEVTDRLPSERVGLEGRLESVGAEEPGKPSKPFRIVSHVCTPCEERGSANGT